MADKEVKKEEQQVQEPEVQEPEVEAAEEEVRIIQVPGDLIVRIFYVCENEGCAQSWQATTRSVPLHCPYCNGPLAIAMMLVQNGYTPEQKAERQARVLAAQQAQLAAQAALQAQQAAQAPAPAPVHHVVKPAMRPIQRTAPK